MGMVVNELRLCRNPMDDGTQIFKIYQDFRDAAHIVSTARAKNSVVENLENPDQSKSSASRRILGLMMSVTPHNKHKVLVH
jgi:hypothetical protein